MTNRFIGLKLYIDLFRYYMMFQSEYNLTTFIFNLGTMNNIFSTTYFLPMFYSTIWIRMLNDTFDKIKNFLWFMRRLLRGS